MEIKFNEKQQQAYDDMLKFVKEGNHKTESYCLSGKAGTGKTLLLAKLVEALPHRKFIVAAISHKAKENIYERISSKNVTPMTIAALLAMKMDLETGEFVRDDWAEDVPIADADIVIIDEASMMHEDAVEYINKKKLHRCVVIYAGDEGQIRPIRKESKLNDISPVFKLKNKSLLTIRVRQGEDNPILEDMDYYWNMTKNLSPVLNNLQRPDKTNEIGSIRYRKEFKNIWDEVILHFKEAVDNGDTNHIKVITYTNKRRQEFNEAIRKKVFNNPNDFEVGDLMIMNDTYQNDFVKVDNSLEFVITHIAEDVAPIDIYMFKYYVITGTAARGQVVSVPVLAKESKDMFDRFVAKLFNEAKASAGAGRRQAYEKAWSIKKYFADTQHAYSITAHRSQGSTYNHVIIDLKNMLSARSNDQEKASLIYTAGTRARKSVVMVHSDFNNNITEEV